MNLIMRGIHMALEPLRYKAPVKEYNNHTQDTAAGAGETLGLIESIKYRRRLSRAMRELSCLSDATLKDIGVERGNIPEIVVALLEIPAVKTTGTNNTEHAREHDDYTLTGGAAA